MSDSMMSSVPAMTSEDYATPESARAAVLVVLATAAVVGGTYYVVRRGIDRRIARAVKAHFAKNEE